MPLLVIYNPVSGSKSAKQLFLEHVLPLLAKNNHLPDKQVYTEFPGHAGTIVAEFLDSVQCDDIDVILGSGDGTLHEIIDHLFSTPLVSKSAGLPSPRQLIRIVLVPCGTANALYSSFFPPAQGEEEEITYKLKAVKSFIDGTKSVPLTLGITSFFSSHAEQPSKTISSAVVISTAFHASILCDSEALRDDMPGIERFKVAAMQNSTRWFNSQVKLLPTRNAKVIQIYDPAEKAFVKHPDSSNHGPIVHMEGPFLYFLSTVNVDRLEPAFKIAPLASVIPPTEESFDVVIIRPLRSPGINADTQEERMKFASHGMNLLGAAYKDGVHIDMRYSSEGNLTLVGDGPPVVEYVRCGGWEWIPDLADDKAHVVCTDGAIEDIDKGGRVTAVTADTGNNTQFFLQV